ncbi:hypothetical protein LTR95_008913, partial [Oleoguttula sp. CCFEE 5521]
MSGYDDAGEEKRRYIPAHSPHHQIPTISKYREEKENRLAQANAGGDGDDNGENGSSSDQAKAMARRYLSRGDDDDESGTAEDGNDANKANDDAHGGAESRRDDGDTLKDTSEVGQASHPKAKRKGMKKRGDERAEREVTDPITHLPVKIFDFTQDALDDAGENDAPFGSTARTATGLSNKSKSDEQLRAEMDEMRAGQEGFNELFPPPSLDGIKHELADINKLGMTVGLVGVSTLAVIALALERLLRPSATLSIRSVATWSALSLIVAGGGWALIAGIRDWTNKRIETMWEEEIWESNRKRSKHDSSEHNDPESTRWLNSLVASVWPLVNPDLFISLADTLEDVMQASLPRLVRMVSVDDIGQGSEALRILGVRWLPTGAAARSVGADGKLKKAQEGGDHKNDRTVPGEGEVEKSEDSGSKMEDDKENKQDGEDQAIEEGMEAEEGHFINLEVSFAYRAR